MRFPTLPVLLLAAAPLTAQTGFGPYETIITQYDGARSVVAVDLDGDGDADVLSAAQWDGGLVWFENLDSLGSFGPARVIAVLDQPDCARAADLDGDDDLDVFVVTEFEDEILWFANLDGLGTFGAAQLVSAAVVQPTDVTAADLDGDDDLDLLCTSESDGRILWFEHLDGLGGFGPEQLIADTEPLAKAVCAADLDGDGDLDVLSGVWHGDEVAWYENLDGLGSFGPPQVVVSGDLGMRDVRAADLDEDGDADVLIGSAGTGAAWFENLDGQGHFGPQLQLAALSTWELCAADLDADKDLDVLFAFSVAGQLSWRPNLLRPFTYLFHALAGSHGAPLLTGEGPLVGDTRTTLTLGNALENSTSALVVGVQLLELEPFLGGVLVPDPALIVFGLPTGASGSSVLEFRWPPGIPAGSTFYLQHWIVDPAGPAGYAASNGLSGTTPP